jgi:hypothetical protein
MEENKSSVGGIIGTIIIIALIILGGLYFWGKRIEEAKNLKDLTNNNAQPTLSAEEQAAINETNAIKSTSSSDELDAIETDLSNTKTTGLSAELDAQ